MPHRIEADGICITKVLSNSHLLAPHGELIHDTPFLEHCTFGHVCPSTDNHMSVLLRILLFHFLDFSQELRRKVLDIVEVSRMDMKYIRMGGNLYLDAVNLHQPMSILDVFLVDEVIGVTWIHDDDNPVLNSLLTDGEHNLVKLFLTGPFLCFITNKGGDTLN